MYTIPIQVARWAVPPLKLETGIVLTSSNKLEPRTKPVPMGTGFGPVHSDSR